MPSDMKASTIQSILDLLKTRDSFCLSGHQGPDADVVGSQLALASLIERLNPHKRIAIQNAGSPPRALSFLPGYERVENVEKVEGRFDVAIVFECSGADRMGNIIDLEKQAGAVINLDHHLHNPNFGTINLVEPDTSSTAELVFKIIDASGLPVTSDEAVCLYMGLTADTGWFRYNNTNPQTHRIAARLIEAGVPVADLAERAYMSRSETSARLFGWTLSNMELLHDGRLAVLAVPTVISERLGANGDDFEELVNAGLVVGTVRASVLLKEKPDGRTVKISLRSKGTLDINRVARAFGGGGHRNASGCAIDASLDEARRRVLKELESVV